MQSLIIQYNVLRCNLMCCMSVSNYALRVSACLTVVVTYACMSVCTFVCVIYLFKLLMYLYVFMFYLWNRSRNQPFTLNARDLLRVVFKAWPVSHLDGGVCRRHRPFADGERMFRVVKILGSWHCPKMSKASVFESTIALENHSFIP